MTNQPVFDFLRAEVNRTQEVHDQSKEDFWKIGAEVSSGRREIELAAHAQTVAMLAYTKTLHRFNSFILNGTVPDDLFTIDVVPQTTDTVKE